MIHSPREKLQILRKKYKISQLELVMNKISRSHLAMIETGKTKLSKKVAQTLVENFNIILNKRGINNTVTFDYLIEDTQVQIIKKRAHYIESINKGMLNEELIFEIETFIKVADIESKVVLYNKIGDYYFNLKYFERAYSYYFRTFDEALILNDIRILENLVLKLSTINEIKKNFINNLTLEKIIKNKINDFYRERKNSILENFVNSFFSLGENDKALFYVEILLKESCDKEKIYQLELLKAKIFEKKEIYPNSISIYRGMLLKYKDENKKIYLNIKLMNIYKIKGEPVKVQSYYRKNICNLKKINICKNIEQCSNYEMGLASLYLEKKDKAIDFFKKVLNPLAPCSEEILINTLYNLLKLSKKSDYSFIKSIENIYFTHILKEESFKIGYLFVHYYKENFYFSDETKFLTRMCSII